MVTKVLLASVLLALAAGCSGQRPPATGPVAAAAATGTATATAAATATLPAPALVTMPLPATPTPLPPPEATAAPPTETPLPSPTPTSGPLNDPVPALPIGGASCQDYPCPDDAAGWEARIQVPPGYRASYFARVVGNPTSIAFGPDGRLYVALMGGSIVAVDQRGRVFPFFDGLSVPVALAFEPATGRLFVSSRAGEGEAQVSLVEDGRLRQVFGGVPCCYAGMHAANGIAFGPDGFGYLAVGARADHGEVLNSDVQDQLHPWEASILRFSPDGRQIEVYARGLRNAYDIAWDGSGRLFASDNGPDFGPPDEFHLVVPGGEHGYPWYDCDVCFPAPAGVEIIPPLHELPPHSAPTGLTAYLAEQFPGAYNDLFLTLWSAFGGAQKVVRFGPGGQGMTDFATGFAAPIDVTVGPEGDLFVADWATGLLFKISY